MSGVGFTLSAVAPYAPGQMGLWVKTADELLYFHQADGSDTPVISQGVSFGSDFVVTNHVANLAKKTLTVNAGSGLAGGGLVALGDAVSLFLPAVGPGAITTGGATSFISSLQTDQQGRVLALTTGSSSLTVSAGSGLSGGGTAQLGGNVVLSLPLVGPGAATAGGGGSFINSVQTDAQGRIVALTTGTPTGTGGFDAAAAYTFTGLHTYARDFTFDGDTRKIGDATHRAAEVNTLAVKSGASQMLFTSAAAVSASVPAFKWDTSNSWNTGQIYQWMNNGRHVLGIAQDATSTWFAFNAAATHYLQYDGTKLLLNTASNAGLVPAYDNYQNLGTAALRWGTLYTYTISAGDNNLYLDTSTRITVATGKYITTASTNTIPPAIAWVAPSLQNGWVNYDTGSWNAAGYYKDAMGFVHLRGLVKSGTVAPAMIFTLAGGYRPGRQVIIAAIAGSGIADLRVTPSGDVTVSGYLASGSNFFVSLEGITFYAEL
jgi:hypothetical protein